jgi:hypothetical protein
MTVVLIWIVRVLIVLMVVRYLVRMFTAGRPTGSRMPQRLGGQLVRDPQCGTYLPPARALTISRGGERLHFCSDRCRDAWTAARS